MIRLAWFLALALVAAGDGHDETRPRGLDAAATIRAGEAHAHVAFLADTELEGRESGSRGGRLAARYLASQFEAAGLEPAGPDDGWFQEFPIPARMLRDASLEGIRGGVKRSFELALHPEGVLPLLDSASGSVAGPVVFAGFGIASERYGYDDYAGTDVKGSVVLVFRHAPRHRQEGSPFAGGEGKRVQMLSSKLREAADRGAIAMLVMHDQDTHDDLVPDLAESPWPSLESGRETDAVLGPSRPARIPALQIGTDAAAWLLETDREGLRSIQRSIEEEMRPQSRALGGLEIRLDVSIAQETRPARNVLGRIRGDDPDRVDEIVVIGAHFDHVGRRPGGIVFHGADDNASGTAAIVEIAEAFADLDPPPARTILIVGFAAEEKGILGSRYFVDHPPYPEDARTIAMINCDMVGRNDPDRILLSGAASSPELHAAALEAATHVGLRVDRAIRPFLADSDQKPFYDQGIPVCFFFSGLHEDYHQPTDTVDRVDATKIARVAQTAFLTALAVADHPGPLQFVPLPREAYLGLEHDPGDERGLPVVSTRPHSPAATAGLRVGDRIVRVRGRDLARAANRSGVRGTHPSPAWVLREELQRSAPGDVLPLVVVRDGTEVTIDVVLGEEP